MSDTAAKTYVNGILSLEKKDNAQSLEAVSQVLSAVPEDRQFELAELLVEFTQKNDVLLQFISQVITIEVAQTKQESVLFREDCFAVKCINRILFSELGKKYLTKLVTPIIKSILAVKEPIDISAELLRNDPKAFRKNLELTVSLLDNFLTLFNKSPQFCPILFREIFSIIQQKVDEKFGNNHSPFVLDFIFFKFICPAIISPVKYELVPLEEENNVTLPIQRSLVNVSKILNNLAHNITEKFEDDKEYQKLVSFIEKNHSILVASLKRLVDPEDISRTKDIITASVSDNPATIQEKNNIEEALTEFLTSVLKSRSPAVSFSSSTIDKSDLKDKKYAEMVKKSETLVWTKKSSLKNTVLFSGKEADTDLFCLQAVTTIKCPLKKVFEWISNIDNQPMFYAAYLSDPPTLIKESGNYKAYSIGFKFPFPLNPRFNVFSQWAEMIDDKKAYIVMDQYDEPFEKKKGHVIGKLYVSGWFLDADEKNSKYTKMRWFLHGHPGGSVPTWVVNNMSGTALKTTEVVRKYLEKEL